MITKFVPLGFFSLFIAISTTSFSQTSEDLSSPLMVLGERKPDFDPQRKEQQRRREEDENNLYSFDTGDQMLQIQERKTKNDDLVMNVQKESLQGVGIRACQKICVWIKTLIKKRDENHTKRNPR